MEITCYNCGVHKECDECGAEYWREGITYRAEDFDDLVFMRAIVHNECPVCGSWRCEQ
jgi:hypothetical protein